MAQPDLQGPAAVECAEARAKAKAMSIGPSACATQRKLVVDDPRIQCLGRGQERRGAAGGLGAREGGQSCLRLFRQVFVVCRDTLTRQACMPNTITVDKLTAARTIVPHAGGWKQRGPPDWPARDQPLHVESSLYPLHSLHLLTPLAHSTRSLHSPTPSTICHLPIGRYLLFGLTDQSNALVCCPLPSPSPANNSVLHTTSCSSAPFSQYRAPLPVHMFKATDKRTSLPRCMQQHGLDTTAMTPMGYLVTLHLQGTLMDRSGNRQASFNAENTLGQDEAGQDRAEPRTTAKSQVGSFTFQEAYERGNVLLEPMWSSLPLLP